MCEEIDGKSVKHPLDFGVSSDIDPLTMPCKMLYEMV